MSNRLPYGGFQAVMRGSILSSQRCPICASLFKHREAIGLFCPQHPAVSPQKFLVRFGVITRRFSDYQSAFQFLTGLRFERGAGKFDPRDYQVGKKPLSFTGLLEEWLEHKQKEIKPASHCTLANKVRRAAQAWGHTNVKDINYGHIEDLMEAVPYSAKSKKDLLAGLKAFFVWIKKRYDIEGPKDWPRLGVVEMRFRNTIDLNTQDAILESIRQHEPYRAWLAIKFLTTYISIRPGELLSLIEGQVDRERGLLIIPKPKEKSPKVVPLTDEDKTLVKSLPAAFSYLSFFRHTNENKDGFRGIRKDYLGLPFHHSYLVRVWKRACKKVGVEGVDLYGGTKHSTAMGMRAFATYEEVRTMTGHATNKAFERYYRTGGEALKELYTRRNNLRHLPTDLNKKKVT